MRRLATIKQLLRSWVATGTLEQGQAKAVNRALDQLEHATVTRNRKELERAIDQLAKLFVTLAD